MRFLWIGICFWATLRSCWSANGDWCIYLRLSKVKALWEKFWEGDEKAFFFFSFFFSKNCLLEVREEIKIELHHDVSVIIISFLFSKRKKRILRREWCQGITKNGTSKPLTYLFKWDCFIYFLDVISYSVMYMEVDLRVFFLFWDFNKIIKCLASFSFRVDIDAELEKVDGADSNKNETSKKKETCLKPQIDTTGMLTQWLAILQLFIFHSLLWVGTCTGLCCNGL